ncbi:MAG: serine hydroxymethyltransferase [Clostridia bacterium]|nr:serine hydroxymethyltransferase [Clostridia bacterium]
MSKVFDIIEKEQNRQNKTIELIASENFVSEDVRRALASCLTNKYSEGYPTDRYSGHKGRYYGGCQFVDELEEYCCDLWRKVFDTDYHVNVQPHSGSSANLAAYMAVLKPGDTILSMRLSDGGHLTHGSPVNIVGKIFHVVNYDLTADGFIDYADIERKIRDCKPALVLAGASAYSRIIDFAAIRASIEKVCAELGDEAYRPYFMVDMAHIAGLVAGQAHPSPFGIADIVTTTTHKTLRGARGGLIFCRKELAGKIDSGVFPCCQGGALQHAVAGKAVTAEEACTPEYREYIRRVVRNSKAMCDEFIRLGYRIVTGGTDNHLFVIDLSETHPHLTGKRVQDTLDKHDITVNKNCVPFDKRSPVETSGIRIGTAAMTTKGYKEADFEAVARRIDAIIRTMN